MFILSSPHHSSRGLLFDADFWNNELLPKLIDNCLAPEIVSPIHVLSIPAFVKCNSCHYDEIIIFEYTIKKILILIYIT